MEINMTDKNTKSSITITIDDFEEDGTPTDVRLTIDGELSIFNSLIALHGGVHMVAADLIRVAVDSTFPDCEINAREEVIAQLSMPIMSLIGFNLSSLRQTINSIVHEINGHEFEYVQGMAAELSKIAVARDAEALSVEEEVDDKQSE